MTQAQTAFFTAASLGLKNDKKRALNDVIRGIKETIDTKYADAFSVSGSTTTFSGLIVADSIDVQTLNAANLQFSGDQTISGDFDITGQAIINERLLIGTLGSTANPAFSFNNDKNTGIYSPGADQFAISTNGAGRLFINSSGNVGIRTSSPGNSLEVVGDYLSGAEGHGTLNITSNNTGNGGQDARPSIGFSAPFAPANESRILYGLIEGRKENAAQGLSAGFLAFSTSPLLSAGPVERVRINSLGRVGIGTTNPGVALDVNGDARAGGLYGYGDTNTGIDFPGSDVIVFKEGGAEAARVDSSGRLLVGTSSSLSGANFQVAGAAGGGSASASLTSYSAASDLRLDRVSAGGYAVVSGNSLGTVQFRGYDGTGYIPAASITAAVDGTSGTNDMPGRLVFSTTADGASSPTEAMRITSDRYVRLASGSGGIQFNGDTAAANALDDYEEGTWTPSLFNSGGTQMSTSSVAGRYIKIGSQVTCWGSITATSGISGTLDPYMLVRGLPFPVGATSPTPSPVGIGSAAQSISGTEFKPMFARAYTQFGQTQIFMYRGETAFTGGTGFKVVLSYRTID